jgi:hypothetical protein
MTLETEIEIEVVTAMMMVIDEDVVIKVKSFDS